MSKEQRRVRVTVNIPVDLEHGSQGLVYVTSPLIRGIFLALHGHEMSELNDYVASNVNLLTEAVLTPIERVIDEVALEE